MSAYAVSSRGTLRQVPSALPASVGPPPTTSAWLRRVYTVHPLCPDMALPDHRGYGRCLRFRRRAVQGGDQPHGADVAGRSGREGTAGVVLSAGPHAVRRWRTWGPRATVDGGTATAEMAVALPVLVLVLCGALWAVGCVAAQLRCTDVAGAAARAAARGEPAAEIIRRARTAGPAGATVTIEPNGSRVSVQVSAVVRPFGGLATRLAGIRVTGQAAAAVEEVIDSSPAAMGAASVPSGPSA